MNVQPFQIFGKRFYRFMKISNPGKRSFLKFGRFKIGCVRESNLKIPKLKHYIAEEFRQKHYQTK